MPKKPTIGALEGGNAAGGKDAKPFSPPRPGAGSPKSPGSGSPDSGSPDGDVSSTPSKLIVLKKRQVYWTKEKIILVSSVIIGCLVIWLVNVIRA